MRNSNNKEPGEGTDNIKTLIPEDRRNLLLFQKFKQ